MRARTRELHTSVASNRSARTHAHTRTRDVSTRHLDPLHPLAAPPPSLTDAPSSAPLFLLLFPAERCPGGQAASGGGGRRGGGCSGHPPVCFDQRRGGCRKRHGGECHGAGGASGGGVLAAPPFTGPRADAEATREGGDEGPIGVAGGQQTSGGFTRAHHALTLRRACAAVIRRLFALLRRGGRAAAGPVDKSARRSPGD